MARCEEGYPCDVCGQEVELLRDSELYLRYVIGELEPERLHTTPERHLGCNPVLAQFIEHPEFSPIVVAGPLGAAQLDADFVAQRRQLISRGFQRLLEIEAMAGDRDVTEYPLPEAIAKYK
ncbi:hypothetical protein SH139x_000804 [Planctomycetaceae bacterium SH139]